ncbi:hypothetical protein LTR62_007574 [Meristemomyces frigidus]|uniref:Ketoreductase domain-containing protein n=1 Tax=Meristemomyces frigidus TaxID=1508187 RepID=A0AAN7TAZ4_9PEZI|nr:hypothetical protein LTR62_007574 [Meristemomyces frigidus]
MASYVVTGASRGIGLELVKQLLQEKSVGQVFALSRSQPAAALQDLVSKHSDRLQHVKASVDSTESVEAAAKEVATKLNGSGLDVLVNNAGIQLASPGGTRTMTAESLTEVLDVNVVGVQRVTAAFLPLLERGKGKKVINVSSTLGSIAWADKFAQGPVQAYKISKAALNMLNAQYALDFAGAGFTFLAVSPGWLKTDLGGEYADLQPEVGVAELKRIILEAKPAMNGKFVNIHVPGMEEAHGRYDGGEVPW